jgi:hypothetical protein
MIQVYKLYKLNKIKFSSDFRDKHRCFVGHIHLNKFLFKLFFTMDKWGSVKLYPCLMVTVYIYKLIS